MTYISFGKDRLHHGIYRWEHAIWDLAGTGLRMNPLILARAGFWKSPDQDDYTFSRIVFFDRNLAPVQRLFEQRFLELQRADPRTPAMQTLLHPRYWNGSGWQTAPCPLPTGKGDYDRLFRSDP